VGDPTQARPTLVRWRIVALLMLCAALGHFNRISMSVAGRRTDTQGPPRPRDGDGFCLIQPSCSRTRSAQGLRKPRNGEINSPFTKDPTAMLRLSRRTVDRRLEESNHGNRDGSALLIRRNKRPSPADKRSERVNRRCPTKRRAGLASARDSRSFSFQLLARLSWARPGHARPCSIE
jgi:hypothetical protein